MLMAQASGIWELLLVVGAIKEKSNTKLHQDQNQRVGILEF